MEDIRFIHVSLRRSLSGFPWSKLNGASHIFLTPELPDDQASLKLVAQQLYCYRDMTSSSLGFSPTCLVLDVDNNGNQINIPFTNVAAFAILHAEEPQE